MENQQNSNRYIKIKDGYTLCNNSVCNLSDIIGEGYIEIKENPEFEGKNHTVHEVIWQNRYYYIGIDKNKILSDNKYMRYVVTVIKNTSDNLLTLENPHNYIGNIIYKNNELSLVFIDEIRKWAEKQPYVLKMINQQQESQKKYDLYDLENIPKRISDIERQIAALEKEKKYISTRYEKLCNQYNIPLSKEEPKPNPISI